MKLSYTWHLTSTMTFFLWLSTLENNVSAENLRRRGERTLVEFANVADVSVSNSQPIQGSVVVSVATYCTTDDDCDGVCVDGECAAERYDFADVADIPAVSIADPCNSVMQCPSGTHCVFDGHRAECIPIFDFPDSPEPGDEIPAVINPGTTTTTDTPDVGEESAAVIAVGVSTTTFWFSDLSRSSNVLGIVNLKQCSKRNGVAPKQGAHCGGKEKTCFFGNQDGCAGPKTGCFCDGKEGTMKWTCVEEGCAITDLVAPKCNICQVEE